CSYRKPKTENRKPNLPFGRRRSLIVAFIPGAKDFLALLHEPGKGALGTRPFYRRLVQGEIAFGVVAAAVEDASPGTALHQAAGTTFSRAEVSGGGFGFLIQGPRLALRVPGEILGKLAPGVAGAAQEFPQPSS